MRWIHGLLLVLGAAGFAFLVARSGPASLWADATRVGWGVAWIVALGGVEHALHALGWGRCFEPAQRPSRRELLAAFLAGNSVNQLTPTASLGGELARGVLVARRRSAGAIVASLAADRLAWAIADLAFGTAGAALLLSQDALPLWVRLAVAGALGLLTLGTAGFLLLQRSGRLASRLGGHPRLARWIGAQHASTLSSTSAETDARLAALHGERPRELVRSVALHAVGTLVGAVQLAVLLACLGVAFGPGSLLTAFCVALAVDLLAFAVPARLGAQEGGRMLAMAAAGLDPTHGLLWSLVMRVEQLAWSALGLGVYAALAGRRRSRAPAPGAPA